MPKRVLFTGHGGFVGHHCLKYFLDNTDWEFVCLDSFRHKGTVRRVFEAIGENPRVKTYKHDLTVPFDTAIENLIFDRRFDGNGNVVSKKIDLIINMASDSAVERSASDPTACLRNNHDLQLNMLEFARRCPGLEMFLHVSTDEVYGEAPPGGAHSEWATIMPSNPYAASKAAQEAMAIAYWRTYDLPVVLLNCMNMIGERQDPEKFLPKIIAKVAKGEEMPIYAEPNGAIGSRVYLHADNFADAIIHVVKKVGAVRYREIMQNIEHYCHGDIRPHRFHVCGEAEVDNLAMAKLVAEIMGKELNYKLVSSESARPGYDRRYALNGSKLTKFYDWKPPFTFRQSLERIVEFSLQNPHWVI